MSCGSSRRLHCRYSQAASTVQLPIVNWLSNTGCQRDQQRRTINMGHSRCHRTATTNRRTEGPQQPLELSTATDRTQLLCLIKTTKETRSVDVAVPNSHTLHSTITEKLQKYAELKEEIIIMWQLAAAGIAPLMLCIMWQQTAAGIAPLVLYIMRQLTAAGIAPLVLSTAVLLLTDCAKLFCEITNKSTSTINL
jgi:hypothetical protein